MVSPRIEHWPKVKNSRGQEAVQVAAVAGLELDDWQAYALKRALGVYANGKWAAFECGIDVARQNGKGGILEALELAHLFAFGTRLVVHSAHLTDTSLEHFRRLVDLIEATPEFDQQVGHIWRKNGQEEIELKNGQRIRFRTRTKGGGRGFSADLIVFDEAMFLPEMTVGALLPSLSARPNPQVWYTGSAVDQLVHDHGSVWARVRRRAIAKEKRLAYLEWSADGTIENLEPVIDDPTARQAANPALGIRIAESHVQAERRALDARTFAVERLGIGDWPTGEEASALIEFEDWQALADRLSMIVGPICLAYDVTPQRDRAAICAAGRRQDGLLHLEVADARRGASWLPQRIAELVVRHDVHSVSCDKGSPAASMVRPLLNLGVKVDELNMHDYAAACGLVFDLIEQQGFRHLGTDELAIAVKNASSRPLGDAWAWSRKLSAADISPLVAGTIALYQASEKLGSVYDTRGLLAV